MNEPTAPDLSGQTLLITGAGGGLGAALAQGAAAAGAEVVLLGRTVRKLEAVYDAIQAAGGPEPAIYPLDLEGATVDDYRDLAERLEGQCGRLDAIIHNAAILGPMTPLEHYPPLEWARVLQVNLTAPLLLTQAVLALLRRSGSGRVLFLGEQREQAYWGAYGVAKAGVRALATMLGEELEAEDRVRVVHVDPGPLRTPMRGKAFPGERRDEVPEPGAAVGAILSRLAPGGG